MELDLSASDEKALLATARESVSSRLEKRPPKWPPAGPALEKPCGAFVTLRMRSGPFADLRGCIGRMTAVESLVETVRSMAAAAAFEDPRFPAVTQAEYPDLIFEITALSPMRRIETVSEIEIGKHGVYLTQGWHSAVFLPQVAVEQGWDRETMLEHLCAKAGLNRGAWKDAKTSFQVFEGRIIHEQA
jgi:AmmeMemoRadiSam system protein A